MEVNFELKLAMFKLTVSNLYLLISLNPTVSPSSSLTSLFKKQQKF